MISVSCVALRFHPLPRVDSDYTTNRLKSHTFMPLFLTMCAAEANHMPPRMENFSNGMALSSHLGERSDCTK